MVGGGGNLRITSFKLSEELVKILSSPTRNYLSGGADCVDFVPL